MKRNIFFYSRTFNLFILLSFTLFWTSCRQQTLNVPTAKRGSFDATEWNFEKKGILELNGEWEFYWNQLLSPEDFKNIDKKSLLNVKNYFTLPNLWKNYELNGEKLGSYGFATFRLKVILPDSNRIYSLSFERVETAYKLWINDQLINEVGKVADSRENMQPKWLPQNYNFLSHDSIAYITLQISNYNHTKGGMNKFIRIGNTGDLLRFADIRIGFDVFLLGALIIMALYHFGLYFLRRKDKSPLYFAIALLSSAIYLTVNGQFLAVHIFNDLNWEFVVKTNFITNYLRITFFTLFLAGLFKEYINLKVIKIYVILNSVLILFTLVTPARIFSGTLVLLIIPALLIITYLIYGIFKAALNKNRGAIISLSGTAIMFIASLNDSMHDFGIINSIYLTTFGMFLFVFFQSFLISMLNAKSYNDVENLTEQLLILDKIKRELLSISSFNLDKTLEILTNNFEAERGLMFLVSKKKDIILETEYNKNNIIKHNKIINLSHKDKLFNDRLLMRTLNYNNVFIDEEIISTLVVPLYEGSELEAVLYFENEYKNFNFQTQKVAELLLSQIATLIDNANIYRKLETLNKELETKVEQRTSQLQAQNAELEQQKMEIIEKHEEMLQQREEILTINEMLEKRQSEIEEKNTELQTQNEEIYQKNLELDSLVEELKTTSEVLESMNNELEQQKIEVIEKHEELLQQREEILTINEMLEKRQSEIMEKNNEITHKNEQIIDSIAYAKRIQLALLRSEKNLPFADHFILYRPKDIVSGDFYWIKKFFNYTLVAAADCTGHGVPGAFMSMLGISFLSEVANKHFRKVSKTRLSASIILDDLRDNVIKALSQNMEKAISKDGMDMTLCIIDRDTNEMEFAGAYNPAYIIRENQIIELEADKMPIGIYLLEDRSFKNHSFQLLNDDKIYMFSDGYIDQFGGEKKRKFLKKNFKDLLLQINLLEMTEQLEILEQKHLEWRGENSQTDDILVLGIKI